jgi:hypothetical protein
MQKSGSGLPVLPSCRRATAGCKVSKNWKLNPQNPSSVSSIFSVLLRSATWLPVRSMSARSFARIGPASPGAPPSSSAPGHHVADVPDALLLLAPKACLVVPGRRASEELAQSGFVCQGAGRSNLDGQPVVHHDAVVDAVPREGQPRFVNHSRVTSEPPAALSTAPWLSAAMSPDAWSPMASPAKHSLHRVSRPSRTRSACSCSHTRAAERWAISA